MITADQLLAHAVGDYLLQTDWMANQKTKQSVAAAVHVTVYSAVFLLLDPSVRAFAVIIGSHFLIDRYQLARYVTWLKNGPWHARTATGYSETTPAWLAAWLMIVTDNILHVLINGAALKWL